MIKSITHVLSKNYIIFNKRMLVKIKNALFAEDKAPSERQSMPTVWPFQYSRPALATPP